MNNPHWTAYRHDVARLHRAEHLTPRERERIEDRVAGLLELLEADLSAVEKGRRVVQIDVRIDEDLDLERD
ncbi:MAG: hypothetical protein R2834_03255 [Rhodothermales bacterium]